MSPADTQVVTRHSFKDETMRISDTVSSFQQAGSGLARPWSIIVI